MPGPLHQDEAAASVERSGNVTGDEAPQGVSNDIAPPAGIEPARLAAEQLHDVRPGSQQTLIEVKVVGDLAHDPRAHRDGRSWCGCVPAFRGHPYLVGW